MHYTELSQAPYAELSLVQFALYKT